LRFDYTKLKSQVSEAEFEDLKEQIESRKEIIEDALKNDNQFIDQFDNTDLSFTTNYANLTPKLISFNRSDEIVIISKIQ